MEDLIQCIVVEDEPLARELIENYILQTPQLQLKNSFENGADALNYLLKNRIDLVFSDIEMPLINGMELAKTLHNPPSFIFTTAYEHFALEGFEIGAIDYIKKPVTYARFRKAVDKACNLLLYKDKSNEITNNYLVIKADGILHRIQISDITYIETLGDYIKMYLNDTTSVIQNSTMKAIEEKLPKQLFFRVHSSYLISLSQIRKIFGNTIVLKNETELPIAKNRKQDLFQLLNIKEE